ncbi:fibronectin type III domain-containing protein [Aquimarina gracilis]|uniref:Fibronectin type III domain-containing protein n=1 Tax=Aquimarina gracilis TaxID=874422 RepID=A0ABU5ZQI5_9FLAO|nr:fibronectin type III domain-containing protein [Aquimarina gracilis]MEB3344319.1 fibronectin type III domain-containing protein [Aquimarina gracilis]
MKPYSYKTLILLLFIPIWINAQVFPVQVSPQVLPPYSLKLSEYATSSTEKLIVNLLLTDINESNVQVRLKFFLENNAGLAVQNNDVVVGSNPIFLDGGVPLRLSNIDLQANFLLQNLIGISPQQYNTPLPEGLYQFCFEVYDVFSGRRISRKSCVPVYLVLNDPPFLNLPSRGEQVLFKEPQNIIFQWTPRHLNATNVSYEFTLTELWDTQMDPQAAFLAGRPLYQTTTFATTLLYGPAEPALLPDKNYGWRVRAMVSDGISETSVFKNDGYSEIHHFTYTGSCAEPELIIAESKNNTTEKIYWQGVGHRLYDIQYRKKDAGSGNWFNAGTQNESTTIYNLEPGTTYEFRVGGQCIENGPYTYSQIYEFTTTLPNSDSDTVYNCGITPEIEIANQECIQQLVINETFTAGDFPVTVKEITQGNATYNSTIPKAPKENEDEENTPEEEFGTSGNQEKTFSGWGYIVVPYLNDTRIKVSFENIKINTDYQLIDGIVETDYDKKWGGLASVNEILDVFEGDNDLRNINLDYDITIEHISIADDGSIVITNPTSGATIEYPGGDDVTIMDTNPDGSRDIFHVDADGNIREGGQMAPGGPISAQNTAGVNSTGEVIELTAQGIKVEFLEYDDYAYGFDRIPNGQVAKLGKYYKQIKDAQGNPYTIINKSVGNGDTDIVRAKVTITDPNLAINDLVIKTIHGEKVDYEIYDDNIITLRLKGYYTFEHENIYATLQPKNNSEKQKIAGVFSQWHLANKNVNVTFIPVNGAALPGADVLGSQINKIFKQASVTLNVNIAGSINIDKTIIGVGETGNLSNYTSDQKALINQFKASRLVDRKSYYVFVFGNDIRPSRASVAGFMPLKRQFGFVFSGNLSQKEEGKSSLAGTLAHELGHGAFALQHPFKKLNTTQSGTDWLMDYGNGMRLSHIDWSQIHNPEFRLYLFQDEEDAALTVSMLAPNGYPITYEGEGGIVFTEEIPAYSNGAAFAIFENDRLYEWDATKGDYFFEGNRNPNVREASTGAAIQLYWHKGSCENNEIYQTTFANIRQNYLINNQIQLNLNVSKDDLPQGISYVGKAGCTDDDCGNIAIPEVFLLQNLAKEITISNDMQLVSTPDLIAYINNLNQCALKELAYEEISKLLTTAMLQRDFGTPQQTERAIVKLLRLVPTDQEEALMKQLFSINQGLPIGNTIAKTTNEGFPEISESKDSVFIYRLSQMVFQLSNDEKWKVFNLIVKNKFNRLEGVVLEALQHVSISIDGITDNQKVQIPSILNLFIDMLRDPDMTAGINDFKIVYEIATVRNQYREQFALFTVADYLTLIRNPNYISTTPVNSDHNSQNISLPNNTISWILPSLDFEDHINKNYILFKNGEFIIEDNYLYNRSTWHRYALTNDLDKIYLRSNIDDFLKIFYEQFLYYINISGENNSEFWNRIGSVNCSNVAEVIQHINQNENTETLKNINKEVRFSFISAYFNQDCNYSDTQGTDSTSQSIVDVDNSLMKMLGSFDATDTSIFRVLEDIGLATIKDRLKPKVFNDFSIWLGMQIMATGEGKPVKLPEGVITVEQEIPFIDPSQMLQLEANIFEFENFSAQLDQNKIVIKNVVSTNRRGRATFRNDVYNYNDIVLVHVSGSFDFLGQRQRQGEILMIPAIQAYAMSESNQRTVIWNSAFLTLDVVSVVFPFVNGAVRVFRLSGHYAAKTILASEIAASSASALVTALNSDAIDPVLRSRIQITSMLTSFPAFFVKTPSPEALATLRSSIDEDLTALYNGGRISENDLRLLQTSYGRATTTVIRNPNIIDKIPEELHEIFRLDFPNPNILDNVNDEFIEGYIKFRSNPANNRVTRCR